MLTTAFVQEHLCFYMPVGLEAVFTMFFLSTDIVFSLNLLIYTLCARETCVVRVT